MPAPQIICLGEALIDFMPAQRGNSITAGGELRMAAGGAPANVAVGLARLGSSVGFIGRVGADFFGQHLREVLKANGVDTTHLILDRTTNTGLAFVNWDQHGDAQYLFYRNPSADTRLEPLDIDRAYLQQARLLQFGSLLLATEPSRAATFQALELARSAGLLISYDLNLRLSNWPDQQTALQAVTRPLDYTNILKLNRHELRLLSGLSDPEAGTARLWLPHFKLIVVTLDLEGSYYRTPHFSGFIPALPVAAVDTVGAGDGYLAGLLNELRRGDFALEDRTLIERACRQAAAVGALVVTRPGAIPAMPTSQEVEQFLSTR